MNTLTRNLVIAAMALLPIAPSMAALNKPTGRCGIPGGASAPEFSKFVASRPTVEAFKARYSCIWLVQPGSPTTYENRTDNSRYFVTLDENGRIASGRFG